MCWHWQSLHPVVDLDVVTIPALLGKCWVQKPIQGAAFLILIQLPQKPSAMQCNSILQLCPSYFQKLSPKALSAPVMMWAL